MPRHDAGRGRRTGSPAAAGVGLVQLGLFRRHDFVTVLVMRLAYYAAWHLARGTARLDVLFD